MSRIRYIKPGFFTDDDLGECQPLARLLFAGLWTIADREGRLEDRPRRIKAQVLPYDNGDADALLRELEEHGSIVRYAAADGQRYIAIPSWQQHQKPHYREGPSEIPAPPGALADKPTVPPVSREQRERIYERDGRVCLLCGSKDRLTIDHITPRDAGGSGDDDNLQTLCLSCNSAKGNRTSVQRRSEVDPTSDVIGSTLAQTLPDKPGGERGTGNGERGTGLTALAAASAPAVANDDNFEHWWTTFGKVGSKADARDLYRWWRQHGASADDLLRAATSYRAHCTATDCKLKHARTFLAKKPNRWQEWADGEDHGSMDVTDTSRLTDVLAAGAAAFGLTGGIGDDRTRQKRITGGTAAGRETVGRHVPALGLDEGE